MKNILSFERAHLELSDPEVASILAKESKRLNDGLELIASENVASPAVFAALSSVLSNKYAEGYPGRRYYGGCEFNDQVEQIAIDRVKKYLVLNMQTCNLTVVLKLIKLFFSIFKTR